MTDAAAPDPAPGTAPDVEPTAPSRRVRVRYVVAAVVCLGVVAWMVFGALRENLVYLQPVSEAVERRDEQGDRRFRMGGSVVPGSIEETGRGVTFVVTEGDTTVDVVLRGEPPDLFEDGAPVVVEGRWGEGDEFVGDRLLIRHGSEYEPPEGDAGTS